MTWPKDTFLHNTELDRSNYDSLYISKDAKACKIDSL